MVDKHADGFFLMERVNYTKSVSYLKHFCAIISVEIIKILNVLQFLVSSLYFFFLLPRSAHVQHTPGYLSK